MSVYALKAQDSLKVVTPHHYYHRNDSIAFKDSVALVNIRRVPVLIDKSKQNTSLDSFVVAFNTPFMNALALKVKMPKYSNVVYADPVERKFKDPQNIYILFALFLLFVVISYFFNRDISMMAQGFINNRILNQLVRDNNLLNSESFIFISLLIGFTFGYLLKVVFHIDELLGVVGIGVYFIVSLMVIVFFLLKTILLRLAGALFSIKHMVNNYISIIYISFGACTLVLIPLLILYALGPAQFGNHLFMVFSAILILSLAYQYIRGAIFISSNFQFSKFYFIVYLCAFEICPLVILYKVLLK
ncbi:hypothetical protein C3K47_16750 [Solitalea longa]|uniref:DUF4271 domain-containing protein n=2 Tax=Solitalea longa TaxID=2079460 RepID=A0A2S4ZYW1_9SPHI|nr:hypothetical protein C3K47_16750 [Solitalea longa]